jgi:hypothetical protein
MKIIRPTLSGTYGEVIAKVAYLAGEIELGE